jgi:uncharacterized protein
MVIARNYLKIKDYVERGVSVLVLGPRGSGKTKFLGGLVAEFENSTTIDLLESTTFTRFLENPSLVFSEAQKLTERGKAWIFIDEVQRLPNLLNEVHRALNSFEDKVCFILTGSSARKLKREGANLLAGRAIRFDFFTLNSTEIDYRDQLQNIMRWGLLPKVYSTYREFSQSSPNGFNEDFVSQFLKTYTSTYLQEEIQREVQLRKLDSFSRLLEFAAIHNGEPVNQRRAAIAAGVHSETAKEYYEILVETLLAYEIPPWTNSVAEKMQLSSKFYLFDNGVINALCDELGSPCKPGTYRFGKMFENVVVTETIKLINLLGVPKKVYHYRTKRGQEIDLILQKNAYSHPIAIEIKSADAPTLSDVKTLATFKKQYPKSTCIVCCLTPRSYVQDDIHFMPFLEGIQFAVGIE